MSCESCLLKRCCCCGSLRTGTLIAGAGAIVGVKYLKLLFFLILKCFFYICKILAILTIIIIALTMCGLINVQIRMIVLDSFLPELASKLPTHFNGDNLVWLVFSVQIILIVNLCVTIILSILLIVGTIKVSVTLPPLNYIY